MWCGVAVGCSKRGGVGLVGAVAHPSWVLTGQHSVCGEGRGAHHGRKACQNAGVEARHRACGAVGVHGAWTAALAGGPAALHDPGSTALALAHTSGANAGKGCAGLALWAYIVGPLGEGQKSGHIFMRSSRCPKGNSEAVGVGWHVTHPHLRGNNRGTRIAQASASCPRPAAPGMARRGPGLVTSGQVTPAPIWQQPGDMNCSRFLFPPLLSQAWRAVDRAYVDKGFNGQSWFRVGSGAVAGTQIAYCQAGVS